jgi:hypothetical protein
VSGGRKAYGGFGISEFGLRIAEIQKGTDSSLRVGDFRTGRLSEFKSAIRNSQSEILQDLAGLPKAGEAFPHSVKRSIC